MRQKVSVALQDLGELRMEGVVAVSVFDEVLNEDLVARDALDWSD